MLWLNKTAYWGVKFAAATATGIPTTVTYGFVRSLMALLEQEKPGHLLVAFDSASPTFRCSAGCMSTPGSRPLIGSFRPNQAVSFLRSLVLQGIIFIINNEPWPDCWLGMVLPWALDTRA